MKKKYFLETNGGNYEIEIGCDIINEFNNCISELSLKNRRFAVVSNNTIWDLYGDIWTEKISDNVLIEDGEEFKNLDTYSFIIDKLLEMGLNRDSVLVAFGGGVVGDITGFVAGTVYRGIKFIQVPTTLLSFVDSSVGGKTGVNHKLGKNLVGVFNQPQKVIVDIEFLKTLSLLDIINGSGEIIKHYFISGNSNLGDIILNNSIIDLIEKFDKNKLISLIYENVKIKGDVVHKDEKEGHLRKVLNYGHTFGHVFEGAYKYKGLTHGYGVMLGMLVAAEVAKFMGILDNRVVELHYSMLKPYLSRVSLDKMKISKGLFTTLIFHDKKVKNNEINLVLLRDVGKFEFVVNRDVDMMYEKFLYVYDKILS